jgi:catechol 2,3-dioxygenase-like lactoylglutathione lyase family enzyme
MSAGLPGLVGKDHTGLTVPDLDEALDFFVRVLGCKHVFTFGPIEDPQGDFMTQALGVHARARIKRCAMIRVGGVGNLELFEYEAPDQRKLEQKNSDIGAFHIALYVEDIAAAKAYLDAEGVLTRLGPIPIDAGPNAGQTILYFQAPWGLQLEAISYPKGMAYEQSTTERLWNPREPGLEGGTR